MVLSAQTISAPVNLLLSNVVWATAPGTPVTLSYDFLQQVPPTLLQVYQGDPSEDVGWQPLPSDQQAMTQQALALISSVANITFVPSTNVATANILIGSNSQVSTLAYTTYGAGSYLPDGRYLLAQEHIEISSDNGVNSSGNVERLTDQFNYTILHELANATGLQDLEVSNSLPSAVNDLNYTVESFFHANPFDFGYDSTFVGDLPVTPQMLDILAWQYLYGANENGFTPSVAGTVESQVGNDHTYKFSDVTAPMTVWIGSDVSGRNCFDFSGCSGVVTIDLTPGSMSGTDQFSFWDSTTSEFYGAKYPLQNVGIAYGTYIQVAIANDNGATLYADATSKHDNLLLGGKGADTFVAGDGNDFFVGKGGQDVAEFHDSYADYKIITGADGGMVLIDQAATPTDGTVMLSPGFTTLEFADKSVTLTPSSDAQSSAIVDQASDIPNRLDALQSYVTSGYVSRIELTDTGVPTLSVTASQITSDAQALAAIVSPYALQVQLTHSASNVDGPGNGIATTVRLPDAAAQYEISLAADGSVDVSEAGVMDHLVNVTAVQFADHEIFFASQRSVSASGVSSAQIANLYAAVFARTPDSAGLAYYEQSAIANPTIGIATYAEDFLSSPEYVQNTAHAYAQTSAGDSQFVTDIYSNLLHRTPEAGAVSWYQANVIAPLLQGLTAGTSDYTAAELLARASVLADFSQSQEFLGDVTVTANHPADGQHWLVLG